MPTPFALNTGSTISGTTQYGVIALGISEQDYSSHPGGVTWYMGPDETLGYVVTIPDTGYTHQSHAGIKFKRSTSLTSQSFIDLTNHLDREQGGPGIFATTLEASNWLSGWGYPTTYAETLAAPSNFSVTGMRDTEIDFEWTGNTINQDGYRIYKSLTGGTYSEVGTTTGTTYTATGLTAGEYYLFYVVAYAGATESQASNIYDTRFKITIDTTLTGGTGSAIDTFVLPNYTTGTYDYYVDWGDEGGEEHITTTGNHQHVYGLPGIYQIKIRGTFSWIYFNNVGDKLKLTSIDNWGNIKWTSMNKSFYGCSNMTGEYIDIPNTSSVTSMGTMFNGCSIFNQSVNNFDTSNVTSMSDMFQNCALFNQPVNSFTTSKVNVMGNMFYGCTNFNQSVSNFITSGVTNMSYMFHGCTYFNQSVSNFDTRNVTLIHGIFYNCTYFNQSVSNFITSGVTNMSYMFRGCTYFNQSVNNFDTSGVSNMSGLFHDCANFNQSVSNFITSGVTNMYGMFRGCRKFNQSVSNFDTSKVENMSYMFHTCNIFNQSVSNFNTSSVINMSYMFDECSDFNQSVSNFITSGVTNMALMFYLCTLFDQNISNFDTSKVESMYAMFYRCSNFNQSVSNFDTSSVQNMGYMFYDCDNFNQSVSNFNTSKVGSMFRMFTSCSLFEQSLANFIITGVTSIDAMLNESDINESGTTTNYDDTLVSWASQIAPTGLTFHGGSSKYGENLVVSGTANGTSSNKLIDSTQNFTTGVTVGDITYNTIDGTYARITNIDDANTLSLSHDIMVSGENYRIQHGDGAKARAALILDHLWTITDGGYL